jgi:type I restriction enzyme R subunit
MIERFSEDIDLVVLRREGETDSKLKSKLKAISTVVETVLPEVDNEIHRRKIRKAFTELLGQEGFPHHLGITITRKPEEVLIEEDLQNFLLTQYAGQGITVNEIKSIILQLKSLSASDLYESNKTFLKMLSDGFILKREDRNQKDIYIQLIDYAGLNKHRQPTEDQLISLQPNPEKNIQRQ